MLERIVVALDGSERADKALDYALTLARSTKGKLHIVHILDHRTTATLRRLITPNEPKVFERLDESGRELLQLATERCARWDVPVTVYRTEGIVAHEICVAAREFGADLIVMGSHGRTGAAGAVLGSVAQGVLAGAPCAVFLVK